MGDSAKGGGASKAGEQTPAAVSSDSSHDQTLKNVVSIVSSLSESVEKLMVKVGSFERRLEGDRRVSVFHGGGGAEATSAGEFQDGESFFARTQGGGRPSYGSVGSNSGSRDPGTKLERPKFVVTQTKIVKGKKTDQVNFADFLEFFDECDNYMNAWETLPVNYIDGEPQKYPGRDRMAVLNLPAKYAKQLSGRLQTIFDATDLEFIALEDYDEVVYWKNLSTKEVRRRIGVEFEKEVSTKGAIDILRKIEFESQFGLIDGIALAQYEHEIKKEILRIQAGGQIKVNKIQIKDVIIAALPDRVYQQELYAKYGVVGTLLMPYEDFSINAIFRDVKRRIENITKEGLRAMTNKAVRERDNFQTARPRVANVQELAALFEDEIQDQVNAAMAGDKKCRNAGVGSDRLLKCRFLGGDKASCTFDHPQSDIALKGKGVSKDQPAPHWLNTGKRVNHVIAVPRPEFPDPDEEFWHSADTLPPFPESHGGGSVDDE